MQIEEAIRDFLLDCAAVAAVTTTIRTDKLDQHRDKLHDSPGIVIYVSDEQFENTLDGKCDLIECTITVGAVSPRRSTARNLALLIAKNNTNPGTGLAGANVTTGDLPFRALLTGRRMTYEALEDGSDTGFFVCESEFYVICQQTV